VARVYNSSRSLRLACVFVCMTPFACSTTQAQQAPKSSEPESPPTVPSGSLTVPLGNQLAFSLRATGVQIYACQPAPTGFAWSVQAPEASLVDPSGQLVVRHSAGPTWESVADGSKVIANKVEAFADKPNAIPALLLKAHAHSGPGRMADVSFIQRLETKGGLAPVTGCDAERAGAQTRVPYSARYYFYRPRAL
jgi:uncharacterized protein DUF3455